MKKTLIALTVAAMTATAAQAAVVYESDDTKVALGGRVDVMVGKFNKDERGDLRNNESRVEIQVEQKISEGFKALAYWRLRFNGLNGQSNADRWDTGSSFNSPTTNKLWAGFQHDDIGRLTFGKQDTNVDSLQMNDRAYIFGGNNNLTTGGDKVVSFRSLDYAFANNQHIGFGLDYLFGDANKADNAEYKYGYSGILFYRGDFNGLGVRFNAGASHDKYEKQASTSAAGAEKTAWRLASEFSYGPAKFGAEYGQSRFKNQGETTAKGYYIEVAGKYQVLDNSSIYVAWERNQVRGESAQTYGNDFTFLTEVHYPLAVTKGQKLTENVIIAGVDYELNKNVVLYTEYAHSRVKGNGSVNATDLNNNTFKDNKFGVGARIYF
ncbi:porin [Conservatibacter flavescens]|uniref:Porin n=1 Tax=Conservatibacter flavescens TaxID=28161 RepID=A0A2M8S553_9PAST|nr:porin [Conservatibacter flavescens]PJG86253.1 porin [Conservatibacter flavescens]